MKTVKESFGLCCPGCGNDYALDVTTMAVVLLRPNGVQQLDGDAMWEAESEVVCGHCGHNGVVRDFKWKPPTPTDIVGVAVARAIIGRSDFQRIDTSDPSNVAITTQDGGKFILRVVTAG